MSAPRQPVDPDSLEARIRRVLLEDWDPHDAGSRPEAHGTYDTYLAPLAALIREGTDAETLVEFLHERERESMCFPSLGTRRLQPVARKLLQLRPSVG